MKRLPSGTGLEVYDTIDSTSAEAKRRAGAGEPGPLWILAHEQTAGYGRRGRAWQGRAGNFAGTFLFSPEGDPASFGQLSFVAAIAVLFALSEYARDGVLDLKWPNDILCEGGKLSGLLLERIDHDDTARVALGVGVNIIAAPSDLPYRAAKLIDVMDDAPPTLEELARRIDHHFWNMYMAWGKTGFAQIRDTWLKHARGVGDPICVRLPGEDARGYFEGLDEAGALILRQGDARRFITAGEIMFGE